MLAEYEKIVSSICGSNWNSSETTLEERDGGYGVAIVLAAMRGARVNLNDLSYAVKENVSNLERAYKRLSLNGIFSQKSFIWNDPLLKEDITENSDSIRVHRAWCHIAGLASGYTYRLFSRFDSNLNNIK